MPCSRAVARRRRQRRVEDRGLIRADVLEDEGRRGASLARQIGGYRAEKVGAERVLGTVVVDFAEEQQAAAGEVCRQRDSELRQRRWAADVRSRHERFGAVQDGADERVAAGGAEPGVDR